MRVILASPRGFCAGVNMAIESLELALARFGTPLYVFHEIVHNRWVVEAFRGRGVTFVSKLDEVPEGAHVLYSAHGVSPEVRQQAAQRKLNTIDATCPLVTRVHRQALDYAQAGYTIVLIGHEGHDEVIGTMGEAPDAIVVIDRVEDVDRLQVPDPDKVAYVTQTTLSVDESEQIIARLRERFPRITGPARKDICYATQNRQEAVRALSPSAEIVLVLGSQNSSNSRRLAELAEAGGIRAHLIDGAKDIDPAWFSGQETVLVTAGASAPETVVQECVQWLRDQFGATIEESPVCTEDVRFALPTELR